MVIQDCEVAAAFKPFSFVWWQLFHMYAYFTELLLQENEVIKIFQFHNSVWQIPGL